MAESGEQRFRSRMRAATPERVRAWWRSRPSWALRVELTDSVIWGSGLRNCRPGRGGSALVAGRMSAIPAAVGGRRTGPTSGPRGGNCPRSRQRDVRIHITPVKPGTGVGTHQEALAVTAPTQAAPSHRWTRSEFRRSRRPLVYSAPLPPPDSETSCQLRSSQDHKPPARGPATPGPRTKSWPCPLTSLSEPSTWFLKAT